MASSSISTSIGKLLGLSSSLLMSAQKVDEILRSRKPTRIAVLVRNKSHLWSSASKKTIEEALSILHVELSEGRHKFLVAEKWPLLDIFVFDVYHDAYEIAFAHLSSKLPVVVVNYGRKGPLASVTPSFRRDQVNLRVAEHHNLNGWKCQPPFYADYTSPKLPSYNSPRNTSLLTSSWLRRVKQKG